MDAGIAADAEPFLLAWAGGIGCAIPAGHVAETMRPLPLSALPDVPAYVAGVSVVRGMPLPVVRLAALLGQESEGGPGRLVVVRSGARRLGLLVEAVEGIAALSRHVVDRLPPLLGSADASPIADLGRRDAALLFVLETSRLVTDDVWAALPAEAAS